MPVPWFQLFESDAGGQTQALPPRSTEVSHSVQQLFTVCGSLIYLFKFPPPSVTSILWSPFYGLNYQLQHEVTVAETGLLLLWPLLPLMTLIVGGGVGGGKIFLCIGCVFVCVCMCVGIQQSMCLPYWSWIKAKIPFMLICRCLKDKQAIFPTRPKRVDTEAEPC